MEVESKGTRPGKVLGVLGGLGPAASAEFMKLLAALAPAARDQDHPRVILYSDPWIPDRSEAIMGKGEDPGPALESGLKTLLKWGADLLAVPCNSAHYFIDRFDKDSHLPLVHIVRATIEEARKTGTGGAWLLSTEGTLQCGIYQDYARRSGYTLALPEGEVPTQVQEVIHLVKANRLTEAGERMGSVVRGLWKMRDIPVIAACTEIPLAYERSPLPSKMMISSLDALARACISSIYEV
ncbi:MAG: aspartate/glutamate racemase family protein [Synergistales bacterium]|nr:aspartate/glutamate racemase family protein [Synergistales bacterium]